RWGRSSGILHRRLAGFGPFGASGFAGGSGDEFTSLRQHAHIVEHSRERPPSGWGIWDPKRVGSGPPNGGHPNSRNPPGRASSDRPEGVCSAARTRPGFQRRTLVAKTATKSKPPSRRASVRAIYSTVTLLARFLG